MRLSTVTNTCIASFGGQLCKSLNSKSKQHLVTRSKNIVCSTTCYHDHCFFLGIGLLMTVVEGASFRHRKPGRCLFSSNLIHAASMLDHTNRHLSYTVSTNSETQTLDSDYAALLLRLDSFQQSHPLSLLEQLLRTLIEEGCARVCFSVPLMPGHLVQHKSSKSSTPMV